jgi:hypothetical protein
LYHHFGNVALSFFLPNVRNVVKSQGWNEKEDCPVTAGEEALDKVLKPYMEDSRMNMMFDFSNMEASEVRDDIQHQSLHPKKMASLTTAPLTICNWHQQQNCNQQCSLCGRAEASTPQCFICW